VIKRIFDIVSSLCVLLVLFPFLIIISTLIFFDSRGGVFYAQERVGMGGRSFRLLKFRTMHPNSDKLQITVGHRDPRITRIGYYLRKFKIDEFPQLINILKGEMSVVGPRPEVPKYVKLYTDEQRKVLTVKPGLTDYASLLYVNESELLEGAENPEKVYVDEIMPHKLSLNLKYIQERSFFNDLTLIFKTIGRILN